ENDLLPDQSKRYLEARKLIRFPDGRMEKHWASHCMGNAYCGVKYNEYLLKIEQKSISRYDFDNEYALHRYELWKQNAIKKIKHARETAKKDSSCKYH
ncbi:9099_t:CDS:2, partial [Ambispora gerdemannii]